MDFSFFLVWISIDKEIISLINICVFRLLSQSFLCFVLLSFPVIPSFLFLPSCHISFLSYQVTILSFLFIFLSVLPSFFSFLPSFVFPSFLSDIAPSFLPCFRLSIYPSLLPFFVYHTSFLLLFPPSFYISSSCVL